MRRSRYVTKYITALMRTRFHGEDIVAEGEPEELNRLDEVMKRLVVVKVLDRSGPGGEEHGKYLKRHIVHIEGQGFEWLENRKHQKLLQDWCEAAVRHTVLREETERDDVETTEDGQPPTFQAVEISRGHAEAYAQI